MVFVIFNWLYVFATTFLCGFAFAKLAERIFGCQLKNIIGLLFCGLVIATVYAQFFSLFMGVGAAADIVLVLACIVIFARWRKEITDVIYKKWQQSSVIYKTAVLILILIWCYCTSRGYMHYDSDLYHAQSIRWIEEYGVVKGLGNIHVRFAYNSSFFALSALYGMKFLAGQPLHAVNGFIALLLSIETLAVFDRRRLVAADAARLSDFARLGALYYLTLIYRDIVSPASDYCVMCVVFYLFIRWLSCLEEEEKNIAPYGLLCVLGTYSITLKLTAGVVLLLLIKPAYALLKEKRYIDIACYFIIGALVTAPWMIRTALISGYLLYPFPALDILDADWKMEAAAAALDAAEIKTWGRGLNNAALAGLPAAKWLPQWFQNTLPALGKLFILADAACIALFALFAIKWAVCAVRKKAVPDPDAGEQLLVLFTAASSYLFWQFSAPLLRYGYAYVLLLIVLTAGMLYRHLKGKGVLVWCMAVVLALAKTLPLGVYIADGADKPYYISQQDYGTYELESFMAEGTAFYYPKTGDRTGYECFPAIPGKTAVRMRGTQIKDGFYPAEK